MERIDEQLAKIEQFSIKNKTNKQDENNNENINNESDNTTFTETSDQSQTDELTQEQVDEGVENDRLLINKHTLKFAKESFFDGKLSIKLPQDYFKLQQNKDGLITLMNYEDSVNCIMNYIAGAGSIDLPKIKKSITDNMKASGMKTTWVEEGSKLINDNAVGYHVFYNSIPNQKIFNFMIYTVVDGGHVIINFNGDMRSFKWWKLLAKSLMGTLEIEIGA